MRALCFECRRPRSHCYCDRLRPFEHPIRFVILQHPRESRNPLGSAWMTHRSVLDSRVIRGIDFTEDDAFRALVDDPEREAWVLYPGERATVVGEAARDQLVSTISGKGMTVFVIDGTWPQAKSMIRHTPELHTLPWIAFETDRTSEYGFRLQPHPVCLSTLEAVHELVDALSRFGICQPTPADGHHGLMELFRSFVARQLAHRDDPNQEGYRRGPGRPIESIEPAKRWERRVPWYEPDESDGSASESAAR